jgi:hypothetical protein
MRRYLAAFVGLALFLVAHNGYAGSLSHRKASVILDEQSQDSDHPYESCSQVDLPLFSEFPPKSDNDLNTYMHYTLLKQDNQRNLVMWGAIDRCDAARLRTVLREAKPIDNVILISGGGILDEAMAMGRMLREFGATTLLREDGQCISACNFLFMGGAVRMVEPGAFFAVHMFDNHASDSLHSEMAHPPKDLASFLEMFPFRSDLSMATVQREVKQKNDDQQAMLDVLSELDQFEEASIAGESTKLASFSKAETDSLQQLIGPVNDNCATTLMHSLDPDSPMSVQEKFHEQCIDALKQPYTVEDWFKDAATDENVKAIQQNSAQVAAMVASYLSEMSISLRFLTDFANTPNSKPRELTIDEMRNLNVVNAD